MEQKYVAYYRVSTKSQEESRLSLEAQQRTVLEYIRHNGNVLIAEYTETESGTHNNRPQLAKAIKLCQDENATLVIAKLDRLARNLHFVTTLMTNKVKFVAADMPDANHLTIHIISAMAEYEHELISERMKASYASRRARDPNVKFAVRKDGSPCWTEEGRRKGLPKAHATVRREARTHVDVRKAWHFIKPRRQEGMSFQKIADALNAEGYKTRRGGPFSSMAVWHIWKRFTTEE